jgi:uncharacterized LabA/DUF88 family protein
MEKSLGFVQSYFPPMSEAEKTKYWDVLSPRFQRFYNFAIEASATNKQVVQDLFDYRIATKALLLNSTNKVKQTILSSGDAALVKIIRCGSIRKNGLQDYTLIPRRI